MKCSSIWPRASVLDVCESIVDCVNKTAPVSDSPTPYKMIRTTNVRDGWVDLSSVRCVDSTTYEKWTRRQKPKRGDVILTREAPLGEVGMLRSDEQVFLGQRLVAYRADPAKLDGRFLLYSMLGDDMQGQIRSMGSGAIVEHMRVPDCEKLTLRLPDLGVQHRIASILSAYDNLIENNTRRIVILEEMVRRLYEEWFIRFRFPGHEIVRMVESRLGLVPEGWRPRCISELVIVHRGRSYKGTELAEEGGRPFVNLKCMTRDGGYRASGLKRYTGVFKESHTVRAGEMVMAITDMTQERRIVARVGRVSRMDMDFGVISMDLVRIATRGEIPESYLYAMFRWSRFADEVKQHANGANVLHLLPSRIEEYQFVCPPPEIAHYFGKEVTPMISLCDSLGQINLNLRATRDLLIPKLISGEIDVSILPMPAEASV